MGILADRSLSLSLQFYLNFVIVPNIFLTMIGFAAHAFRGHTAGSVTFIAGTGFTVALALVAQNLFLAEVIPVISEPSFLENVFIVSFVMSLLATCFSLWRYKETEGREENGAWVLFEGRSWVTMDQDEKTKMAVKLFFDIFTFPIMALIYLL